MCCTELYKLYVQLYTSAYKPYPTDSWLFEPRLYCDRGNPALGWLAGDTPPVLWHVYTAAYSLSVLELWRPTSMRLILWHQVLPFNASANMLRQQGSWAVWGLCTKTAPGAGLSLLVKN
jgi:hypothetical protein